jgi:hypothetical protein
MTRADDRVDLYWIPLGAGGHCVRFNGRVFEAVCAWREHRARRELFHAALVVHLDGHDHAIEMAPEWNAPDPARGVARTGPVEAVDSPRCVSADRQVAIRLLASLPDFPTATWGRDELRTGDMWNSNSLVSWALQRGGVDAHHLVPPGGGSAPGWTAGLVVADRDEAPGRIS